MRLPRLFRRERKSAPIDVWAALIDAGAATAAGRHVSPATAMRCTTVAACVRTIAEAVAQLPLHAYRRGANGGKTRAVDHPLYRLLHDAPNPWTSSYEWRRAMQADLLLHGACYALITRVGGQVRELLRLEPRLVTVERGPGGEPSYRVTETDGSQSWYGREDVFHLEALGGSPVMQAREAIGLALTLEEHGARLFGSGARPGGVLRTDRRLTPEVIERLKVSFDAGFGGPRNSGKTAVLEEGLEWQALTLNSVDAQYLELRKFQVAEIARVFRVPLHKIGELDRATFSNIEHQSLEFVTDCLMPWLKLWEQGIARSLLTEDERGEYFAEFLVDDLVRGDIKSRHEAYAVAALNGFMTVNEIRAAENRPPVEGGDVPRVPLNTQAITAPAPADQPQPTD